MQMTKDEFDTLIEEARERNGDWSVEGVEGDPVLMSFMEGNAFAEVLAEKRELEQLREIIFENSPSGKE